MALAKYLAQIGGRIKEILLINTSSGSGDAGKAIGLDAGGRINQNMLPVGVGADVKLVEATEAIGAGDYVNLFDSSGIKMRLADASDPAKQAHGFVVAAVLSAATGNVFFEGINNQVSGLTPGATQYLSASTPGGLTETPPSATGNIVQQIGVAQDTGEINTEMQQTIELA